MAESFTKTLKIEEVDVHAYRDIDDAGASIGVFIDAVYNRGLLHFALDYLSPDDFERIDDGRGLRSRSPRLLQQRLLPIDAPQGGGSVHEMTSGQIGGHGADLLRTLSAIRAV
jgi:hypothetical protein